VAPAKRIVAIYRENKWKSLLLLGHEPVGKQESAKGVALCFTETSDLKQDVLAYERVTKLADAMKDRLLPWDLVKLFEAANPSDGEK
jgi:hypothetical protein